MRVTIIPSDDLVIVGDEGRKIPVSVDPNYHAIQWNGEKGFIETIKGPNIKLDNLSEFQQLLDKHADVIAEEEEQKRLSEIEFNKPESIWKRQIAATDAKLPRYAEDIIDALDAPTKARIAPETMAHYNEKKNIRSQKP